MVRSSESFTIRNELTAVSKAQASLQRFAQQSRLPEGVRRQVSTVLDELLNNVISYGFADGRKGDIEVSLEVFDDSTLLRIIDDGDPFNPFARLPPDTSAPLAQRQVGGLGIHLVRTMMDEYSYKRTAGKNVVTLVKKL